MQFNNKIYVRNINEICCIKLKYVYAFKIMTLKFFYIVVFNIWQILVIANWLHGIHFELLIFSNLGISINERNISTI